MTNTDSSKRFHELALRAAYTGRAAFTRFLDPALERDAEAAAREAGAAIRFEGGWPDAQRRMAAFTAEPDEPLTFPIQALEIRWNAKFCTVGHRDLLGAVMALGLERDATGDIGMGTTPGTAYLFCTQAAAAYIAANLTQAGRAPLKVAEADSVDIAPPEGAYLRVTVAQLRLDAVLAAGYKLSRAEAQRLIQAGLVKRNHLEELRGDVRLETGDLLSVRGYGRLRVEDVQGQTRKGRLAALLFRYGK